MNEWRKVISQTIVPCQRNGWAGVWDALVAAVLRRDRLVVQRPVTISFWVKSDSDVQALVSQTEIQ